MGRKPKTETTRFVRELREHIPLLIKLGILKNSDEDDFQRRFLGISSYAHWYAGGIRVCYKTISILLKHIKELYNRNKELEELVNKFLEDK